MGTVESKKEEDTLEEAFEKLDQILLELESPDLTLEDSFSVYQRGMELIKLCGTKIDQIEKKMKIIDEEGDVVDFQ